MASTYPLSRPVLAELRNRSANSGLPHRPVSNEGNNYIDQSLALLGGQVLGQKQELDSALRQQLQYVHDVDLATRREQVEVLDKLNDLDRTYSKCFQDMDERFQQVENSLNEIRASNARLHNATKFRLHQSIERVPYVKDGVIRWADEKIYPSTVKSFWQLGHKQGKSKHFASVFAQLLTYLQGSIFSICCSHTAKRQYASLFPMLHLITGATRKRRTSTMTSRRTRRKRRKH